MPRPRNMTAVVSLQKRWLRLAGLLKRIHGEMTRPSNTTAKKSNVVICGRIINNIVCTFAVPDQVTNKTLNELNAYLMRMETADDILRTLSCELEIIDSLREHIVSRVHALSEEIAASKVFT